MADVYTGFLQRLFEYRNGLSMTQEQIADRLGMTQTKYSKFERGALKITNEALCRLAQMGWDIDYIMNDIRKPAEGTDIREIARDFNDVEEESLLRFLATLLSDAAARCAAEKSVVTETRLLLFRLCSSEDVTILRTCRSMIGKTQEQMAELLGLGIKTYRLYERGEKTMTADLVIALSEITGCRASVFLFPEDIEWNIICYAWGQFDCATQERMMGLVNEFVAFIRSFRKRL